MGVITSASILFFNQAKITKAQLQNSLLKNQIQQALFSPYFCTESLKNLNLPSENFPAEGITFGLKLPSRETLINEGDSIDQIEFSKIRISKVEDSFSVFGQNLSSLTVNFEFKIKSKDQTYLKPYNIILRALINPETEQVTRCISSLTEEEACENMGGTYYPLASEKCVQTQGTNNDLIREQEPGTISQFKYEANCGDDTGTYSFFGQYDLDENNNRTNIVLFAKVFHELTNQLVCIKRFSGGSTFGCEGFPSAITMTSDVNGINAIVDGANVCTGRWNPRIFGDDTAWNFASPKLKTSCFCTYKEPGGELQALCDNIPPDADMMACQGACTAQGSGTCYYYGNDVEDFVQ